MLNIAPASFPGSMGPLDPDLEQIVQNALQPASEQVLLQVQTAPAQALIATSVRIIVLKGRDLSGMGKPVGRTFPWRVVQRIESRNFLFRRSIVVLTADTRTEQQPADIARCSFGVTFSSASIFRLTLEYLNNAMQVLEQLQKSAYVNGPLAPITVPGIMPLSGERFFFTSDAVLFAEHTYRQWQGGTQGMSFRVMRGVYYRVGGIRGRSYNKNVVEPDDRGTIALSDRRMLFVGQRKTIEVPLGKITSVQPFTDGLQVNIANKAPVQLHTGSDLAGLMLHRLCTNPPP